jgi:hypothetical protein
MEHIVHPTAPASNPLREYFRSVKYYQALPSGTSYYTPDVIQFTDGGEVGILPMTGKDELALKNPDALLNGEAIIEVLTSCVVGLKNPKALLTNDIDALITAIRFATFNDALETTQKCPSCRHENTYKLDLEYSLANMTKLAPEYVINLDSGVSVFVKPYSFPELMKSLHSQFEQSKLTRALDNPNLPDSQRTEIFAVAFKNMANIKFDLMTAGVMKVIDESRNVNVVDKKFIREFLMNIDKKSADKINDLIETVNKVGIKRTFTAKCEKCKHEWESDVDFNPVNFS